MPFISVKTNRKINDEKKNKIKSELGQAISIIPGKSESWLMVEIEDEKCMYFRGSSSEAIAFVEIKLFGSAPASAYDKLTAEVTDIMSKNADSEEVYVKYEEVNTWGYNGGNF